MSLHEIVIETAARHPRRLAVTDPSEALTYYELDRRANALAHQLDALGVGHGDRVVIWDEKSSSFVVAMQAALRLGAAYVPADASTPAARVSAMAEDCQARVVCTSGARVAQVTGRLEAERACVDLAAPLAEPTDPVDEPVSPDDLAYILYTSGSTGMPKGVCISHRNARAFVDWAVTLLAPTVSDRFANHAPLTFDLSVLDLYAAFAGGASVRLIPAELGYAPTQLVDFLHREQISIWYSVPSALTLMMRHGGLLDRSPPAALRAVLFAGEPFPLPQVRQLASWTNARLVNLYGPTETNVCTAREVTAGDLIRERPVPIGTATCGNTVWAERPDGGVAQSGEEGELLVDGPTVMLGYWGRERQRGPYRTGDIVRVLPDGSFDYIGRRDHMVKVRGHRVELGDVEAALATHPDVGEAAVMVAGEGMTARLEAFVVPASGSPPSVIALKHHIAARLPRYMVIDAAHFVSGLPRTRTGKVDRSALAVTRPLQAVQPQGIS